MLPSRLVTSLPVRGRVAALALIPLVGLLTTGIAYMFGEGQIAVAFQNVNQAAALSDASRDFRRSIEVMHATTRDFVARPHQDLLKRFDAAHDDAIVRLDTIARLNSAADIEELNRINATVGGLKSFFASLVKQQAVLGLDETQGLRGRSRGITDGVEQAIKEQLGTSQPLDATRLLAALETMRRYELQFIAWQDEFDVRIRFYGELGNFNTLLAKAAVEPGTKSRIDQDMKAYGDTFRDLILSTTYVTNFLNAIHHNTQQLMPAVDKIVAAAAAKLDRATAELTASRRDISSFIIVVACLSVALGVALSLLIGIGINTQNVRFDAALSNMAQGLCMFDAQGRVIDCNDRYRQFFALPSELARPGANLRDLVAHSVSIGRHPGQTVDDVMAARLAIFANGRPATIRTRVDDDRTIEIVYRPMTGGGWVATYDDITDRERAERTLAEQNRRFDAALNNMPHGLCMFDAQQRLIVCNQRYADMYQLPRHLTEPGATLEDIIQHRVATGQGPLDVEHYRKQQAERARDAKPSNYKLPLADGRTLQIDYQPMAGGGWVSTHQDISEAIRAEAQISHLARHDALTDLPNRVLFGDRLEEALRRVPRGESIAMLCLDLDQFKAVNDTLGHAVGDELLKAVADRLRACVRDTDTVARLGGDEFAVVQVTGSQPTGATHLAARIIETLSAPYCIGDHQVIIGTSVGIAIAPDDGTSVDQLLKNADLALYRAKSDGRGVYRFFEPAMDAKMRTRRALELDLRRALANDEFDLFYQPLVNLTAREVVGFEALLRWRSPERGLVPPNDFIPLAEDMGLIAPLGAWVLKKACAEAMTWPRHIRIAINLSPVQFKSNRLVLDVAAALASSGLSPQRLELEITETVMLQDTEATLATLNDLKALGIAISMDDFGTGYSSLSYLRKFPFDKIKIDQSFIRGLSEEDESVAIVRAVMGLGTSLGMVTTAEGVETPEQLRTLRAEGCGEAQGFLFSPPVPAGQIPGLLEHVNRELKAA